MPAPDRAGGAREGRRGGEGAGARRRRASPSRNAALTARLRAAGQRVTPQRLVILGAFDPGEHLAADEVFARVARDLPAMTRSTVYRSLEAFRDAGLISETDLGGGVRQFELLEEARHHHLICHGCGAMLDLPDELVQPLRAAIEERLGFRVGIEHLALFGYCRSCRREARGERPEER